MSRRYAENTSVPEGRSKTEIEHILARYGADGFAYMTSGLKAVIAFQAANRHIRFVLPLPAREESTKTPRGRARKGFAADTAHVQEVRRRWRALALSIKANLEVVESGILEFQTVFMPYIIDPSTGKTVAETVLPRLEEMYSTGKRIPLLPNLEE